MKSRNPINVLVIFIVVAGGLGRIANAEDGAALYQSKACVACHGVEGRQPINDSIPKLAGQNMRYLVQQISDIKSGARNNGMTAQMKTFAEKLSESEIEAISAYLSGF